MKKKLRKTNNIANHCETSNNNNNFIRPSLFSVIVWIPLLFKGGFTLDDTDVTLIVPSIVKVGDTVTMYCNFPKQTIYNVKWYKGNREFFRYDPAMEPPTKDLQFPGFNVSIQHSSMNKLVLVNVPQTLRGNITCEVVFLPSYTTFIKIKEIKVVSTPKSPPKLDVSVLDEPLKAVNQPVTNQPTNESMKSNIDFTVYGGNRIVLNCTSGPSIPPPNLTLYINDEPQRSSYNEAKELFDGQGSISKAGMVKMIYQNMFPNKIIKIRCTSIIYNLYDENSTTKVGELIHKNVMRSSYGWLNNRSAAHYRQHSFLLLLTSTASVFSWISLDSIFPLIP